MNFFADTFLSQLGPVNYTSPITYLDLTLSAALVIGLLWYISKFPVFRVVLGIIFLYVASVIFGRLGFTFTSFLFGLASGLTTISLPLIFAPELRHYLEKIGRFSYVRLPRVTDNQRKAIFIKNVIDSTYELAEKKTGATLVFQRRTGLAQTIETGITVNARFSEKLLESIFFPKSPLHDGAVIIQNQRIMAAKCLLPISAEVKLDPPFGTRHRSGLAITRDTDAVVIIVSEQRGEVSLAENGKLYINLSRNELKRKLEELL